MSDYRRPGLLQSRLILLSALSAPRPAPDGKK